MDIIVVLISTLPIHFTFDCPWLKITIVPPQFRIEILILNLLDLEQVFKMINLSRYFYFLSLFKKKPAHFLVTLAL